MADLIIRGMELPKYTTNAEFGIDAIGNPLCIVYHEDGTEPDIYDVAQLPDGHGDLIDKTEAYDRIAEQEGGNYIDMDSVGKGLEECRTIVQAEGGTDDGQTDIQR